MLLIIILQNKFRWAQFLGFCYHESFHILSKGYISRTWGLMSNTIEFSVPGGRNGYFAYSMSGTPGKTELLPWELWVGAKSKMSSIEKSIREKWYHYY